MKTSQDSLEAHRERISSFDQDVEEVEGRKTTTPAPVEGGARAEERALDLRMPKTDVATPPLLAAAAAAADTLPGMSDSEFEVVSLPPNIQHLEKPTGLRGSLPSFRKALP